MSVYEIWSTQNISEEELYRRETIQSKGGDQALILSMKTVGGEVRIPRIQAEKRRVSFGQIVDEVRRFFSKDAIIEGQLGPDERRDGNGLPLPR